MKFILALAVLVTVAVTCNSSVVKAPRANLNVGYVGVGDRLLVSRYVNRGAISNTVQYEDVIIRGNSTNRITAIQASEVGVTQYASARIISGGIGWTNATIRFQSYRGYGYYYLLNVWSR